MDKLAAQQLHNDLKELTQAIKGLNERLDLLPPQDKDTITGSDTGVDVRVANLEELGGLIYAVLVQVLEERDKASE